MPFRFHTLVLVLRFVVSVVGLIIAVSLANAQAVICWTGYDIVGDSDISTQGTTVFAARIGGPAVSTIQVNGVSFTGFEFPGGNSNTATLGNVTFTESEPVTYLDYRSNLGSTEAPFANLSPAYQTLLSSAGSQNVGVATITLHFAGLVVGHDYVFQWWVNQSSEGSTYRTVGSDGAGHTLQLNSDHGFVGSTGHYGIGTFTATALFQDIMFEGNDSRPLLNAFQLRDVSAIPEPSTYAGFAAAVAFGFAVARRRRAKASPVG
jgi:hypothetical protein